MYVYECEYQYSVKFRAMVGGRKDGIGMKQIADHNNWSIRYCVGVRLSKD